MQIPTNRITDYAEGGISVRRLTPDGDVSQVTGLHRDDYYAFCLLQQGELYISIDFEPICIHAYEIGCIMPGQVHQYINVREAEGWLMFIDGVHIGEANRQMMQRFAFSMRPLPIDERRKTEITTLFPMLMNRLCTPQAKDFAHAVTDIFAEVISQNDETEKLNPRHREVLLRFTALLDRHITESRQPSFYADRLNITTGYLNEIITATVGLSTSQYIGREITLRMKRELAYSTDTVQEISRRLGFDEYAYFSRLFTKQTGISPTAFRQKYHD